MSFCNNQILTCDTCNSQTLTDCDDLTLEVGLSDGDYWFTIIDKFGKMWTVEYTVTDSEITLDPVNYPSGFFNSYSATFEIFAHTLESTYTRLDMDIQKTIYKCVTFTVSANCC